MLFQFVSCILVDFVTTLQLGYHHDVIIITVLLQVFVRGLLSFREPFTAAENPGQFIVTRLFTNPFIAPLWTTDYKLANEIRQISYRSTNNTEVLDRLSWMINREDLGISNYRPTLAIILTWRGYVPVQRASPGGLHVHIIPVSLKIDHSFCNMDYQMEIR